MADLREESGSIGSSFLLRCADCERIFDILLVIPRSLNCSVLALVIVTEPPPLAFLVTPLVSDLVIAPSPFPLMDTSRMSMSLVAFLYSSSDSIFCPYKDAPHQLSFKKTARAKFEPVLSRRV